ncbi:hypothetical protein MZO44_16930, partial [Lactiplantibacillus sp. E932]|nr:hypothetical protein [Lactiplantibacillus sp. E932]
FIEDINKLAELTGLRNVQNSSHGHQDQDASAEPGDGKPNPHSEESRPHRWWMSGASVGLPADSC